MHGFKRRLWLACLLVGAMPSAGCASSLEYRNFKAKEVMAPSQSQQARLMMTDIMDGRDRGSRSDLPLVYKRTREKSLGQLRQAMRKHAKRSGLVSRDEAFATAPKDPAELDRVLAQARSQGAKALLITRLEGLYAEGRLAPAHGIVMAANYLGGVGLAPSLIVFSIPLSGEYASAKVAGYLVDTSTGNVFATCEESFVRDDPKVTMWGFSPTAELKGVLFNAMEKVFEKTAHLVATSDPKGGPQTPIATVLFDHA